MAIEGHLIRGYFLLDNNIFKKRSYFPSGHCRKGTESSHWRCRQEKIFGPVRSDSGTVLFLDKEEDPPEARRRIIFLCK